MQGVRRSGQNRGIAAQILPVPARSHRLRQGQGVEGRQVCRYRQGQHRQRHRSAVDAQAAPFFYAVYSTLLFSFITAFFAAASSSDNSSSESSSKLLKSR